MGKYLDEAFERLAVTIDSKQSDLEIKARFATAAITLNKYRQELGIEPSERLENERDKCAALIRYIRNAFAHDVSEPVWDIRNPVWQVVYDFDDFVVSLVDKHDLPFTFEHIGGSETLFALKERLETCA